QVRARGPEGDVARHVEDEVVAVTRNRHARALQLRAQFGFLLVHVRAHARARQRTDAGADQRALASLLGIVARGGTEYRARQRTDAGALGCVVDLFLAGIGV